jgi:hypothetical protein
LTSLDKKISGVTGLDAYNREKIEDKIAGGESLGGKRIFKKYFVGGNDYVGTAG